MSNQYSNELKIALFPGDKSTNPKRPDWRGTCTVNGVEYAVSIWEASSPRAPKYLRGVLEVARPREQRPAAAPSYQPRPAPPPQAPPDQLSGERPDEDVPF